MLNALLFGLVGLQLRPILNGLADWSPATLIGYGALVSLTVIVMRIAWVFLLAHIPYVRLTSPGPRPPWQRLAFVGWAGMRGAITLAAALAIPSTTDWGRRSRTATSSSTSRLGRVLATLVLQGLSLPFVIRVLGLEDDGLDEKENAKARIHAADAALERLDELVEEGVVREDTAGRLRGQYSFARRASERASTTGTTARSRSGRSSTNALRRELLDAERSSLVALRNEGRISEGVMQRVQRDLDLEDSRLDV